MLHKKPSILGKNIDCKIRPIIPEATRKTIPVYSIQYLSWVVQSVWDFFFAVQFMTSWHKEEEEASRRRATKRDSRDLEPPTHL